MWRLLIWVGLVIAAWWWLRRRLLSAVRPPAGAGAQRAGARALAKPEAMVDCARCGLHLPASEALSDAAGQRYCCAEHRDAGPRAGA
jgi:uncharacterized protein